MPKSGLNVALKGLDDLFSSEETRQEEQREQVQQIPVDELFPFKNHPFKVLDDDAMTRTVESISQFGVLAPLIARPRPEGGYEIISGHRRKHAAELAHLDTVPVIVRNMEDDAATILMVDSNLQREHILPSERAFAYKMKLDIKNCISSFPITNGFLIPRMNMSCLLVKFFRTFHTMFPLTSSMPYIIKSIPLLNSVLQRKECRNICFIVRNADRKN